MLKETDYPDGPCHPDMNTMIMLICFAFQPHGIVSDCHLHKRLQIHHHRELVCMSYIDTQQDLIEPCAE